MQLPPLGKKLKTNMKTYDINKLSLYCSEQAHSSIDKGVITLGLPLESVVKIKTDDQFRMIPSELMKQ